MQLTRSQEDRFCFLDALATACRVGQIDPPTCFFGLNLHQMTRYHGSHVPLLGRHVEINPRPQDFLARLAFWLDRLKRANAASSNRRIVLQAAPVTRALRASRNCDRLAGVGRGDVVPRWRWCSSDGRPSITRLGLCLPGLLLSGRRPLLQRPESWFEQCAVPSRFIGRKAKYFASSSDCLPGSAFGRFEEFRRAQWWPR
jgi:hypothetical protein